jgi:hypothetical protein
VVVVRGMEVAALRLVAVVVKEMVGAVVLRMVVVVMVMAEVREVVLRPMVVAMEMVEVVVLTMAVEMVKGVGTAWMVVVREVAKMRLMMLLLW